MVVEQSLKLTNCWRGFETLNFVGGSPRTSLVEWRRDQPRPTHRTDTDFLSRTDDGIDLTDLTDHNRLEESGKPQRVEDPEERDVNRREGSSDQSEELHYQPEVLTL